MNILKKILSLIIVFILLFYNFKITVYASPNNTPQSPVKVGVFLNDFNDLFIESVKNDLEDIQKENENKIEFTFFNAGHNQSIQNESIDEALIENFDLFVINPVNTNIGEFYNILNKIIQKDIPLIMYFGQSPSITNFIIPSPRSVIIDTDVVQSGILQGKIIVDTWNANKEALDRNKDNIMQYIIFKGPVNSPETNARTKYSIQEINNSGIKTELLSSVICSWEKECAKTAMESLFLTYGTKVEVIISNNDAMAIGAIEALQKYGYNTGDKSKYIPVFGVDALPEAQKLIKEGIMAGTVVQNPREHADAIYAIGMNLISGADPLNGTNYKFDKTGVTVKLPYYEYVKWL